MTVLTEEKLCAYLTRVLELSNDVLRQIPARGSQPIDDETLDRFHALVNDLNAESPNDSFLSDVSWNWIWESKSQYNYIQVYGRLAWINLQLLEIF